MYPPHDLRGGYELTWRSAVEHLRDAGHSVRVLTTDYRAPELPPDEPDDPEVHRDLRWYWHEHDFPRMSMRARVALERHNAGVLERHLSDLRPDVVNWWGMGGMSLGLVERVRRARVPAVGVVGDEWMRYGPRVDAWMRPFRRRARIARLAERLTGLPAHVDLGGAALWLFNSEFERRSMRSAGIELPRAEVAHPGIDEQLFRPAPERPWEWRLLYLGRMDTRKGVHVAVEALAHLPEATLSLQGAGDPGYVEELRVLARRLGVDERVAFVSVPREELPRAYAEADAVLFPVQWEEPWGLVPLEAMAVGRPVVASGTGGSREYLVHERNCLLYEPVESGQALADAVRRLAGDPALRGRLRDAGFETAEPFTERAYNEAIRSAIERCKDAGR
jgi:glycosyltransferase involved in cell wall biosynthesis